jgi:putative PIN family toxin of toxin-antitoxin system
MPNRPRCVVDTNVFISAALSGQGNPNQSVYRVLLHGELLASAAIFYELETRLRRPKFEKYITPGDREAYLTLIQAGSRFVEIGEEIEACRDSDARRRRATKRAGAAAEARRADARERA